MEQLVWEYYKYYGDDLKTLRETYCQCGPDDWPEFKEMYDTELDRIRRSNN